MSVESLSSCAASTPGASPRGPGSVSPALTPGDVSPNPPGEMAAGSSLTKLAVSGLHEWLSVENKRMKQWWASRTGTDMHKVYLLQVHDTDELRSQLNEQLRALDVRLDVQTSLVSEVQDWFRRRAELHMDYSSKLDKLAKSIQARHKENKVKREQWSILSMTHCWHLLVAQTRKDSRDHAAMADVYINNIVPRFTQVHEDVQRIYKKCRDIGYESHEELLKVLHELHTTMRTYHTYQAEFKSAELKLNNIQAQRSKLEQAIPKEKLEKSRKFKVMEKETQKRNNKYLDARLKALKARNEYILSMDSANAAIHKYFVEDLSDIVDCMDFGFHSSLAKALLTHISGQECFKRTLQNGIDDLNKSINNLDSRLDKQRFLELNNQAFMLPKKFEFQSHKGDELTQVLVTRQIQEEMEKRYAHMVPRLTNLKTEAEETWKTIETAEKTLLNMINARDYDIAHYFTDEAKPDTKQPEAMIMKRKSDRQETEEFYLGKFRDYTLSSNLIIRLQARFDLMRKALGEENHAMSSPTPTRNLIAKPRRRRIGRTPLMGQPRLFGGSLEEYLEVTGQDIPLIMKSCIRVINLYGLHHQGIFRVSGSQLEINNFRESFEKMDDPLADVTDASDINSVAGVLKLYLRELREPIFPTVYFEQFMEIAQLESKQDFVSKVRDVVTSLPRPVFVVMRYLFAFLNHLSEFSDENMMDPYNLAICFGPTLVPIPEDKDQVQYQNLVNELIKNIIIFSEDIFLSDFGPVYEKYISRDTELLDNEVGDAPQDDTVDSEQGHSEDDSVFKDPIELHMFGKSEILEAVAQFDFSARSQRELSFNKGDLLTLHSQVSNDWWRGSFKGNLGLVPDKYILIKIRDEDKERLSERLSDDLSRRRTSMDSDGFTHSHNGGTSPGSTLSGRERGESGRSLSPQIHPSSSSSPSTSLLSLSSAGGGGGGGMHSSSPQSSNSFLSSSLSPSATPTAPSSQERSIRRSGSCSTPGMTNVHSNSGVRRDCNKSESYMSTESIPSIQFLSQNLNKSVAKNLKENVLAPKMRVAGNRLCASLSESCTGDDGGSGPESLSQSMAEFEENFDGALFQHPSSEISFSKVSLSSSSSDEIFSSQTKAKPVSSGAPDLVMDLPVGSLSSSPKDGGSLNSSPKLLPATFEPTFSEPVVTHPSEPSPDNSSNGSSPGTQSPETVLSMTAAECFAKQNQSTLKKVQITKGNTVLFTTAVSTVSTDAQTQTLTPVKMHADPPGKTSNENGSAEEIVVERDMTVQRSVDHCQSLGSSETPRKASVSMASRVKSLDTAIEQLEKSSLPSKSHSQSNETILHIDDPLPSPASQRPSDTLMVEIRSASDSLSVASNPPLLTAPSTPKLAARYLQAVAASGGNSRGVAVKPSRLKPSVMKKPSLPKVSTERE